MKLNILSLIVMVIAIFYLRFSNPEMTETQLIVNFIDIWALVFALLTCNIIKILEDQSDEM